jgi:hypothetical protein
MSRVRFSKLVNNFCYFLIFFLVVSYSISPKLFSKLNINFGVPVYTTELVILIITVLLLSRILLNGGKITINAPLKLEFMLFFLIFLISLFTGLFLYEDSEFVLRQSALFYYSIFYFLVIFALGDVENLLKLKFIFWLFFISVNLMAVKYFISIFGINFFKVIGVTIEGMGGAGYFYISLLMIIEISLLMYMKKNIYTVIFFIDIIFLLAVAVLYSIRGDWVALIAALLFFWIIVGITPGLKRVLHNFNVVLLSSVIIITLVGLFVYIYNIGSSLSLFIKIKREFLSIFDVFLGNLSSSGTATRWRLNANLNTIWRLINWNEMFRDVLTKPVLGFGFGNKFLSYSAVALGWTTGVREGWVESHNYLISFLYRSGFLGLGSFILIIVSFFRKVFRFLRNCLDERIKIIIAGLASCIIYILVLGLLEVVLEIPYMGSFLWIIMGFIMVIINYYNKRTGNISSNDSKRTD